VKLLVAVGSIELMASRSSWYKTPDKWDTLWISTRKPLPWYEAQLWYDYLSTVKDLLSAGF